MFVTRSLELVLICSTYLPEVSTPRQLKLQNVTVSTGQESVAIDAAKLEHDEWFRLERHSTMLHHLTLGDGGALYSQSGNPHLCSFIIDVSGDTVNQRGLRGISAWELYDNACHEQILRRPLYSRVIPHSEVSIGFREE